VQTFLTEATGERRRDAAMLIGGSDPPRKARDVGRRQELRHAGIYEKLRGMNITPHVAQNTTNRRSAVDERTTRHAGYEGVSGSENEVEQSFGWMKMIGMLKRK